MGEPLVCPQQRPCDSSWFSLSKSQMCPITCIVGMVALAWIKQSEMHVVSSVRQVPSDTQLLKIYRACYSVARAVNGHQGISHISASGADSSARKHKKQHEGSQNGNPSTYKILRLFGNCENPRFFIFQTMSAMWKISLYSLEKQVIARSIKKI